MSEDHGVDVSRETLKKLQAFGELVRKWTSKINLVSTADASQIWERHIVDSVQLFDHAPLGGSWLDLGSGGGFPGIVVAIMSQAAGGHHKVTLVESDVRKCVFLRTAVRELDLAAAVVTARIEDLPPANADILTARALAPLERLCAFANQHLSAEGTALFPKGAQWEKELKSARDAWSFNCDVIKSSSLPDAAILKLKEISRV